MERRIPLDDLIDQTSACMRDKLKLSLRTVYGQSYGYMKVIQDYCLAHGEKYYNPILLNEFQQELESRYERGEIKQGHYLGNRKCLERLTEYYNTGTLSWTMHKLNQKYRLFDEDKALLEEFLQTLVRDPNTNGLAQCAFIQSPQFRGITEGHQPIKGRIHCLAVLSKLITGQIQFIPPDDAVAAYIDGNTANLGRILLQTGKYGEFLQEGFDIVQLGDTLAELDAQPKIWQGRDTFNLKFSIAICLIVVYTPVIIQDYPITKKGGGSREPLPFYP